MDEKQQLTEVVTNVFHLTSDFKLHRLEDKDNFARLEVKLSKVDHALDELNIKLAKLTG